MRSYCTFTVAAFLAGWITLIGHPSRAEAADAALPQYFELRVYTTLAEIQQQRVVDYWKNAAIPAYNRQGIQPIGVFTEQEASATNKIYVLIPCDSLEVFAAIPARLEADTDFQRALIFSGCCLLALC